MALTHREIWRFNCLIAGAKEGTLALREVKDDDSKRKVIIVKKVKGRESELDMALGEMLSIKDVNALIDPDNPTQLKGLVNATN